MTSTGMVMGTPHYMSPEQVRGAKADARSDVFALGCVLYEMLTGRKPFDAESMHAVLFKIMQEDPVPLREAAPGTPEALSQVVERALAKNPAERFPDAGDMLAGIRLARLAVAAGKAHERVPTPTGHRRRPTRGGPRRGSASTPRPSRGRACRRRPRGPGAGGRSSSASAWASPRWWRRLGASELGARPAGAVAVPGGRDQPARPAGDRLADRARPPEARGRRVADAVRQAEGALKLDPENAAARQVLTRRPTG